MNATIQGVVRETVERDPGAVAAATPDLSVTYGQLLEISEQLARRLTAANLAERRIGVLLPNEVAYPAVLQAIFGVGGSALLLNPANSARELGEQMADAGVREVVTVSALMDRVPDSATVLRLEANGTGTELTVTLEQDSSRSPGGSRGAAGVSKAPARPAGEAAVIFTSATDGRFRGASLTHRNLVANLRSTSRALGIGPEDRVLAPLPFAHGFGLTVCMNTVLANGAAILPMPRFSPALALDWIESLGVTMIAGVPAMYLGLLAAAEKRGTPRHSLKVALCGGAPLAHEVQRQWEERFGLPLRQGYGLTEASPVCLFNGVDRPNVIGTLGTPVPGVEVTIQAPDGEELPEGEVGEICVRGENVFDGYLGGSPDDTFRGDWLRTGDLGTMENGLFRFRGTIKKMFTRNGFNVYPEEIRRVLKSDPRVEEVSVGARPDPERENEIVLEVRPAPGANLTEDDVRALCRANLASYKQPGRVRLVNGRT